MNINQGCKRVAEFAILFCSITTSTGWLYKPLIFKRALSELVRSASPLPDAPTSLDASAPDTHFGVEPMQVDGTDIHKPLPIILTWPRCLVNQRRPSYHLIILMDQADQAENYH